MYAVATAPHVRIGLPCSDCGESVLSVFTDEQHSIVLDAEPSTEGIYRFDAHGRAVRQSLAQLYRERRAGRELLGYASHECSPRPYWADR